jgi:hypothetical protein
MVGEWDSTDEPWRPWEWQDKALLEVVRGQADDLDIEGARITASSIRGAACLAMAWFAIGRAQAKVGDAGAAARTYETAADTAVAIPWQSLRMSVLERIVRSQAQMVGVEAAKVTADKISCVRDRDRLLLTIVDVEVRKGSAAQTLATLERIQGSKDRDAALHRLVGWLASAGRFEESRATLTRIAGEGARVRAITSVARCQAESDDLAGARATFRWAVAVAMSIGDFAERDHAVWSVVQAQIDQGDPEGAQASASAIGDEQVRTEVLDRLGEEVLPSGEETGEQGASDEIGAGAWPGAAVQDEATIVADRRQRIDRGLASALDLADHGDKAKALIAVIHDQIQEGDTVGAGQTLETARGFALMIRNPTVRAVLLGRLVDQYASLKDYGRARATALMIDREGID